MTKYVLCRPEGGLNDILCQIEKCCRYGEQYNRTVIVDTNHTNARHFRDEFSRYFYPKHKRLFLSADAIKPKLELMNVYPNGVQDKLNDYNTKWRGDWRGKLLEAESGQLLTFDFSKLYPEQLLLHHSSGGGTDSLFALLRMGLRPHLVKKLSERLNKIGGAYDAVHVRNTDYQTDYKAFLDNYSGSSHRPLFLATDNISVVKNFKRALGHDRVFSFSDLPEKPTILHSEKVSKDTTFRRNSEAILDLLMLSLAVRLKTFQVNANPIGTKVSGFSKLASSLWESKILIKNLLSDTSITFGLN